ncbi:MAG TPA: hypothetical protein VLU43_16385 [Anaeromyxobacteraceae bacterium]|nr:hypothetical protein [Anaeromyxobacteraceae bacterium]
MTSHAPHVTAAFPFLALLAACGGGTPPPPRSCTADGDCGPHALCVSNACVADAAPRADFTVPSPLATNRLLRFVSTASDPDDGVAVQHWSVTAVDGACAPDPESGEGPALDVLFLCPGAFDVELWVVDGGGLGAAPRKVRIQVAQTPGAPSVTAGPALAADHRCSGEPLACRAVDALGGTSFALDAAGLDPDAQAVTYQWTAVPPARPEGSPAPTATFTPGATAQRPTVTLSSDGGPIAGTWRFKVRVRDVEGLLGQSEQLLVVGNRPPEVAATTFALPHRYDGSRFVASGPLAIDVVDPDGDPVEGRIAVAEPGASCVDAFSDGTLDLAISCDAAADLALARSVDYLGSDGNGGVATAHIPLAVLNRPPVVALDLGNPAANLAWVPHTVRACDVGACFSAKGTSPFIVDDPDGDPLGPVTVTLSLEPNRPNSTGAVWTDEVRVTRFEFLTPVTAPFEFRDRGGMTGFHLHAKVSDPWVESAPFDARVAVANHAPALDAGLAAADVDHTYDLAGKAYRASATFSPFVDPDGDPIALSIGAVDPACEVSASGAWISADCSLPYDATVLPPTPPPLATFVTGHAIALAAADPWETVTGTASVNVLDRPPAVWAGPLVTNAACQCDDGAWLFGPFTLPVAYSDPDGDPVVVQAAPGTGAECTASPCRVVARPPTESSNVDVTVTDGLAVTSGTYAVTATCGIPKPASCRVRP